MWEAVVGEVKVLFFHEEKAKASGLKYQPCTNPHPAYVSIYMPVAGWKAQLLQWCTDTMPDGMVIEGYQPWNTSFCAYRTAEEAYHYASKWARDEDVHLEYMTPEELKSEKSFDEEKDGLIATLRALDLPNLTIVGLYDTGHGGIAS